MDTIESLRATAAAFGNETLLISSEGHVVSLAQGYIPLLVNFTFEDKTAKGLRKRKADDKIEAPVYFSALELVRDYNILLLTGGSGCGKTTFAKFLCSRLVTGKSIGSHSVFRNEDAEVHDEEWEASNILPCYFSISGLEDLNRLTDDTLPGLVESAKVQEPNYSLLIIIDSVENLGVEGPIFLTKLLSLVEGFENTRLLILGESSIVKNWALSSEIIRHDVRPLLEVQRRQMVGILTKVDPSQAVVGTGAAAAIPAYFALALEANHSGDTAEDTLDKWLAVMVPKKDDSDRVIAQSFDHSVNKLSYDLQIELPISFKPSNPALFFSKAVQRLLVARHLVASRLETAITLFHSNPVASEPILRSLLTRLSGTDKSNDLIEGLISGSGVNSQLGALLVSGFVSKSSRLEEQVTNHMLSIIQESKLPITQREKAGQILSRLGDPRDLTALANIPAGNFILGCGNYPNSQPVETISLKSFRIGIYPVINRDYSIFIQETGRNWHSPDGLTPEKQNAPATDLSWHDARAYCAWLTPRWQSAGKINPNQQVRLPNEPEWERAARGSQNTSDKKGTYRYPWGTKWLDDAANHEESGLNTRCTVGLFPKGCSPEGCFDMAGQIWEWCSTLWGEDMSTPSYGYPWRGDDGREDLDTPDSVRRVLRGGCFSSGRLKICCTYRGSLEAWGFWRGNGFRVVVANVPS